MYKIILSFLLILSGFAAYSQGVRPTKEQNDSVPVFQFSGMVIGQKSQEAIPYVQVQVNHSKRGVMANGEGFYSIPVTLDDTLYYYHVAYRPTKLIVRKYLQEYKGSYSHYIYVVNYMKEDSFSLKTVYIYPWKNYDEVVTSITNMPTDPFSPDAIARDNLDPKVMDAIMASLPKDADERVVVGRQMYYDFYRRKDLMPTVGLDPVAAVRLLQYVVQKAKEKRNKGLNYWEE
ncbi:MAG: hypothetical protein K1X92_02190 [Bacteroidia bacterium]|nr:hypothetical protein [Bacteroidia bacterium]